MEGGIVMDADNFDDILRRLNHGENPTWSANDGGLKKSERIVVPGTKESQFALRPFNEEQEYEVPASDN